MAAPMRCFTSRSSLYFVMNKFATSSLTAPYIKRFHLSKGVSDAKEFDECILDTIACPLSKNPLRYDATASELVNDELGVAYKIIDGIPNLIPQDARRIKQDEDSTEKSQTKNGET